MKRLQGRGPKWNPNEEALKRFQELKWRALNGPGLLTGLLTRMPGIRWHWMAFAWCIRLVRSASNTIRSNFYPVGWRLHSNESVHLNRFRYLLDLQVPFKPIWLLDPRRASSFESKDRSGQLYQLHQFTGLIRDLHIAKTMFKWLHSNHSNDLNF